MRSPTSAPGAAGSGMRSSSWGSSVTQGTCSGRRSGKLALRQGRAGFAYMLERPTSTDTFEVGRVSAVMEDTAPHRLTPRVLSAEATRPGAP